jgi:hypothetical protein
MLFHFKFVSFQIRVIFHDFQVRRRTHVQAELLLAMQDVDFPAVERNRIRGPGPAKTRAKVSL